MAYLFANNAFVVCVIFSFCFLYLCEVSQSADSGLVSKYCIGCLCHAASQCNLKQQCSGNGKGKICGPFLMTKSYWQDAGGLVLAGDQPLSDEGFENCAKDAICSRNTIIGYMNKFKRDCDGDKRITCDDFAKIHIFGPSGCQNPNLEIGYYKSFDRCRKDPGFRE